MMDACIAGVDIGGTNTRIAIALRDDPRRIIARDSFRTPVREGPESTIALITEKIDQARRHAGIDVDRLQGVGCTIPGVTDTKAGMALFVSNLVGWDNYPLANKLSEAIGVPAVVENDVNAAAYGEYTLGSGVGCHSIVYLTISTGIAAGIVIEGQLIRGFNHGAGELGYFIPDPKHIGKDWSPSGCLEMTSAGIGLAGRWAKKQNVPIEQVTAVDVFKAAQTGDRVAKSIVDEAADYIAQVTIAICTIVDPERLILGGSVAQYQSIIPERIQHVLSVTVPYVPDIRLSAFEGDVPLIGALALAQRKLDELDV